VVCLAKLAGRYRVEEPSPLHTGIKTLPERKAIEVPDLFDGSITA
jgi:hypothetical protein